MAKAHRSRHRSRLAPNVSMALARQSVPQPAAVAEGRERKLGGKLLPQNNGQPRPYYCRSCGTSQQGIMVPRGWYSLMRSHGEEHQPWLRLGMYCSAQCLSDQMPRIIDVEKLR